MPEEAKRPVAKRKAKKLRGVCQVDYVRELLRKGDEASELAALAISAKWRKGLSEYQRAALSRGHSAAQFYNFYRFELGRDPEALIGEALDVLRAFVTPVD